MEFINSDRKSLSDIIEIAKEKGVHIAIVPDEPQDGNHRIRTLIESDKYMVVGIGSLPADDIAILVAKHPELGVVTLPKSRPQRIGVVGAMDMLMDDSINKRAEVSMEKLMANIIKDSEMCLKEIEPLPAIDFGTKHPVNKQFNAPKPQRGYKPTFKVNRRP